MWKIGDHVVHRRDGVCRIAAVEDLALTDDSPKTYYILTPVYESASRLYVPYDRADQILRDVLTKEEIDAMIFGLKESGPDRWISDKKARQQTLSETVKTGSEEALLKMVSTLFLKKAEQAEKGLKFHAADEHILNEAEKMINREFAFVLGIEPDDVPDYVGKIMEAK